MRKFPDLIAQNLLSQKGRFPSDLNHDWTVVLTGFMVEHQASLQTWMPYLEDWEHRLPSFRYLEMPVLPPYDFTSRASIFLSMKWYIPEQSRRERTYTVYTDIARFLIETNTPSTVQSRTFLLDRQGYIHLNAAGSSSPNLAELFTRKMGLVHEKIWKPDPRFRPRTKD